MGEYDDIINLPHKQSNTRAKMSLINRAAQFSPFAALTGHAAAINETARITKERIILEEDTLQLLDREFQMLKENISQEPIVTFTYFVPDKFKSGGEYVDLTGKVKKIDEYKENVVLEDGRKIPMVDVINIQWNKR